MPEVHAEPSANPRICIRFILIPRRNLTTANHSNSQVSTLLKSDQGENAHHVLTDSKIVEPRTQFKWTLATAIINPIVAVWCDAQLAEPPEDNFCWRAYAHTAIQHSDWLCNQIVTRIDKLTFLLSRSPGLTDRIHRGGG